MEYKRIITVIKPKPKLDFSLPDEFVKRRTAAYARVSTDSEEQLNSYEAQKDYYPKFIATRPNWEFVGLYCDEGLSGTSSKRRPAFNRMIADALDGKIDLIVTKSISRFARNTLDTLTTIRKLKKAGCEVWFEKENLYSFDSKGEFILTLLSSMAQEESRSLSENVKWGVRKRFADGKYSIPYAQFLGYKRGKNGKPAIVEEEAKIVRLIYRLYLEGNSFSGITRYLTAHGIPTPSGKTQWQNRVVESILTNEKYYGAALLQKNFVEDYLTKKSRKNNGELPQFFVENDHDPIVGKAVFMEVQSRIECGAYINPLLHNFSNKLICGMCKNKYGSKLAGAYREFRPGHMRHTIWYCNRKYTIPHEIRVKAVKDDVVKFLFAETVQELWAARPGILKTIKESLSATLPAKRKTARIRDVAEFLYQFKNIYPPDLAIDQAAVQVMLDYGEVLPDGTIRFHFITGERITGHIPPRSKLPPRNQ